MNRAQEVLAVIAECKAKAKCLEQRQGYERLISEIISTDIGNPQAMADNLKFVLDRCAA